LQPDRTTGLERGCRAAYYLPAPALVATG
jgi:hypothetical protein